MPTSKKTARLTCRVTREHLYMYTNAPLYWYDNQREVRGTAEKLFDRILDKLPQDAIKGLATQGNERPTRPLSGGAYLKAKLTPGSAEAVRRVLKRLRCQERTR